MLAIDKQAYWYSYKQILLNYFIFI